MIKTLDGLKKNKHALIKELKPSKVKNSLLSFGCIPGKNIEVTYKAPFGGPIIVFMGGISVMMGKIEAKTILIE